MSEANKGRPYFPIHSSWCAAGALFHYLILNNSKSMVIFFFKSYLDLTHFMKTKLSNQLSNPSIKLIFLDEEVRAIYVRRNLKRDETWRERRNSLKTYKDILCEMQSAGSGACHVMSHLISCHITTACPLQTYRAVWLHERYPAITTP